MLLQAGGLLLLYEGGQVCVKLRMRYELKEREEEFRKERLSIPLATYNKCRVGGDELRLDGKMYDVRSVKISGANVDLVVVHDEDEESIVCMISNISGDKSDDDIEVQKTLIELMSFVYLLPESYVIRVLPFVEKESFTQTDLIVLSRSEGIAVPPPWVVSCIA